MTPKDPSPISTGLLAAYALPGFALAMPMIPAFVFLPALYGTALGLSAAGFALLIARGIDVLVDPIVGLLSDRWTTRWGRRKPWIVGGAIIGGIAIIQLFQPPPDVTVGYFMLWSVLLYIGWTLVQVPYTAWGAELSTDYHQRARITSAREGVMVVGILAAGAVPAIISGTGGTEQEGYTAVSWMAVLIGGPLIALMLWRVPDIPPQGRVKQAPASTNTIFTEVRQIARNRPFLRLITAWFINGLATGIPASLFLLYLEHGLHANLTERGVLTLVYFFSAVAAIPIWLVLSKRWGKHRVWCISMLLACLAFVWVPLLVPGQIVAFGLICVVTGMALGADLALPPALQADVVDYDTLRSGQHRAGLFFALWSMSTKLAFALAVGIAFPLLGAFGFIPSGNNEATAILALTAGYALVPVVLKVAAIVIVWGFPITAARQSIIRKRLDSLASRTTDGRAQHAAG